MKTYKLVFTCQSIVNQIPDSQTLFGALCNIIKNVNGEEALEEYLHSFNEEPLFVHSSMFYNGTMPMIKKNIFSLAFVNNMVKKFDSKERLSVLENLKKYKKIKYISEQIYQKYIIEKDENILKQDLLEYEEKFKLNDGILMFNDEKLDIVQKSVLMTRNGFVDSENNKSLFYSPHIYFDSKSEFCIFVKSKKDKEYLRKIFGYLEYFGIGNRRTVGMNIFHLERIEETKLSSKENYKLILSKYIPQDEVIFEKSYCQLDNEIYRASKDYANYAVVGNFIHVVEGSYLYMKEDKNYYGKVIETECNGKKIYHYGIGFAL